MLFLNVVYFPVWLSILVLVSYVKYSLLNYLYKVLYPLHSTFTLVVGTYTGIGPLCQVLATQQPL